MAIRHRTRCARICVAVVAASLIMPPYPVVAANGATTLAGAPLRNLNPAKPNVVLTLDDAGHMGWDFAPDYVAYAGSAAFHCRDRRHCGGATAAPGPGYSPNDYDPPLRSADYNSLYYDPAVAYQPGRRDDGTNLPCEGTNATCAGPWTAVYADGFAGYPAANPGAVINLATNFPDTAWCWKSAPTVAEIQTAFTDGSVCRRNGLAYGQSGTSPDIAPAANAGYNYPNGIDHTNGLPTACAADQQCRFVHPFFVTGNPYYYTIAEVGFCATSDAVGWGIAGCSGMWDAVSRRHVRFGAGSFDPQAFTRVDIKPPGILVNGVAAANPSGRTYAAEMANFATWHAFHRTRMLATKTATGLAFSALGQDARVGFHILGASGGAGAFLNVADFDYSHRATWFARMYETPVAKSSAAPVGDAMWRIGEYFANRASGLPGAGDPLDPTTGKCQLNHHLLAIGGYANVPLDSAHAVGNQDRTVPTLPAPVPGLAPGTAFPRPHYEGPTATSNTLADVAMNHWVRDLRPDLADQVADAIAPWQHLSMHALSLAVRGSLDHPTVIDAIGSGAADWPASTATGGPETIDDLWHAAVNGRGRFALAANAKDLTAAFAGTLAEITDPSGAGTAAAISVSSSTTGARYGYRTSFGPGGWGDVRKYALDPDTGAIPVDPNGNPASAPLWSAAAMLDAQAAVTGTPPAHIAGWDTERRIVTINDATGAVVPFRLGNLSASQRASLIAGWQASGWQPTQQQVLDFLRGDRSNEGNTSHHFRVRSHLLGDIVHSAAVPVAAPNLPYDEAGNPGYTAFRVARRNRTPMVYVGANDGMLHAIADAQTGTDGGKEAWAFVPKALFAAADPNDATHTPSPAIPARRPRLSARGRTCLRPPVLRRRNAARVGRRLREHQPLDAPDKRERLAHGADRRTWRRRSRSVRTRCHRPSRANGIRSRGGRVRARAVGIHARQPRLRLRRADAGQDPPLRLGRADRVRPQQPGRRRQALRRESRQWNPLDDALHRRREQRRAERFRHDPRVHREPQRSLSWSRPTAAISRATSGASICPAPTRANGRSSASRG